MTVARSKKCTAREPLLLKTKAPACVEAQAGVSVSKKSFLPAWSRNTPSAQPVSVCYAPENRGPSSKQARFIRRWRRFACFPFLGFPRTPFLTVTENLPHLLTVTRPPAWKRRRASMYGQRRSFSRSVFMVTVNRGRSCSPLDRSAHLGMVISDTGNNSSTSALASGSEQPKG